MREHKFRAWHEEAKEMFYENETGKVFQWLNQGQPIIIEQFTGLKDKNGVDIYEGDIIMTDDGKTVVVFEDYMFGTDKHNPLVNHVYDTAYGEPKYLDDVFEVIGNIHEVKE